MPQIKAGGVDEGESEAKQSMTADDGKEPQTGSSKYDLTRTISKYVDLHMMFPLLDFVETTKMYPAEQVAQARLDLLEATNMVRANSRQITGALGSGTTKELDAMHV